MQNGGGLLRYANMQEDNGDTNDSVPLSSGRSIASYITDPGDSNSNSAPVGHLANSSVHRPVPAMYITQTFPLLNTSSTFSDLENRPSPVGREERSKRNHFTKEQLDILERFFIRCRYPDYRQRDELAQIIHADEKRLQVWFKNRRSKLHKETGSAIAPPKNILRRKCSSPLTMEMASPSLAVRQAETQFGAAAAGTVQEAMVTSASGSPVQVDDDAACLPLQPHSGAIHWKDNDGRQHNFTLDQISGIRKAANAFLSHDPNIPVFSNASDQQQCHFYPVGTAAYCLPYLQCCAPVHPAFRTQDELFHPNHYVVIGNYGQISEGQPAGNNSLEATGTLVQESEQIQLTQLK